MRSTTTKIRLCAAFIMKMKGLTPYEDSVLTFPPSIRRIYFQGESFGCFSELEIRGISTPCGIDSNDVHSIRVLAIAGVCHFPEYIFIICLTWN